ncbi:MAG: hypothetical protein HYS83_02285 [Candidatus Blackburnbacteria bacterium]|nr:hypothetical protein [Candidatus Blackburnbacteria bacterium]
MGKQEVKRKKQKVSKIFGGMLLLLILVIGLQLTVGALLAGKGQELSRFDAEAAKLLRDNQALREELAQKNALSKIAQDISRLELAKPEKVIYLDASLPVAFLPR